MTDDPIQRQNSIVESLFQRLPDAAQRDAFHALPSSFSVLYRHDQLGGPVGRAERLFWLVPAVGALQPCRQARHLLDLQPR
ncbi:hypothetical protein PG985_016451 [Apiospora marii]|uniref:uncharacterized protein n=1 Tax=Apiospora marii TaxID=335849 RepID=UPI00312EFC7B